jgi:hypothetical protein
MEPTLFEETRRCLLNSYHSYVQSHAGYMIALIIGFIALFASVETFWKDIYGIIAFLVLVGFIVAGSIFDYLRIAYWSALVSNTIVVIREQAVQIFNETNPKSANPYFEEAPYTAILQNAVIHLLQESACDENQSWRRRTFMKYVLRTAHLPQL